jgi:hypothetical protein
MPTIEIVPLRFNLGNEADEKLFAEIQKRYDKGERNESLKELLYGVLVAPGSAAKKPAPPAPERAVKKVSKPGPVPETLPKPQVQNSPEGEKPAETAAGPKTAAHGEEESSGDNGMAASFMQ